MIISGQVRPVRQGLTLIELLTVLVILIALASLIVPLIPNVFTRASSATSAAGASEAAKAIIAYQSQYGMFPNNWDALTDGTNPITYFAGGTFLPSNLGGPGIGTAPANGQITFQALTAPQAQALINAGITTLQAMATTPTDPTYNIYNALPTANTIIVTTTTPPTLALLDPANNNTAIPVCVKLNLALTGRYVLLGIGQRCDLIGKTMLTAPTVFGDSPILNPEFGYQRFVAIFKVSDSAMTSPTFTTATFVGVVPIFDTGIGVVDDHLQKYYRLQGGGS